MHQEAYESMKKLEDTHWWFVSRRKILSKLFSLNKVGVSITEIGCGTGRNLEWLSAYGDVTGIEPDEVMVKQAKAKGFNSVLHESFPVAVPPNQTDNVCLFDVLEHIEDDLSALKSVFKMQRPGQRIFITVPAYQWLYGKHDQLHHHFKRYYLGELEKLLEEVGYKVVFSSYFNTFLFPLAVVKRLFDKLNTRNIETQNGKLNPFFKKIFQMESYLLPKLRFHFGLSVVVIAEKPN